MVAEMLGDDDPLEAPLVEPDLVPSAVLEDEEDEPEAGFGDVAGPTLVHPTNFQRIGHTPSPTTAAAQAEATRRFSTPLAGTTPAKRLVEAATRILLPPWATARELMAFLYRITGALSPEAQMECIRQLVARGDLSPSILQELNRKFVPRFHIDTANAYVLENNLLPDIFAGLASPDH